MSFKPKVSVMAAMADGRRRVDAGDVKGAIRCFDRAVRLDPGSAQALIYRAGLKLLDGDEAGALEDFREISRVDHSRLPAYRDLTTLSAEEFPALIPAVDRVLARDPKCAWAHLFRAFSLRSLMRYEDAVADCDRALECEPKSAALWAMRSRVKLTNHQAYYEGVADMERAVKLAPRWGWLQCWLGEALRHRGDFRRALKALDRGVALDPRYKRGYAWRGGVLVGLKRWKRAIADLTASLAYDPIYHYDFEYTADQKSWAYNQLMLARRGLGDVAGALADLDQAHRFGPRFAWVYNPRNEPAVLEKGLAELDAALAKNPRLHRAWAWRGKTLLDAGRPEEALASLERACALAPRAAWPRAWTGRALLSLGRAAEAERALSKALALAPDYAPGWGWRGEARRALGKLEPARRDFAKAVRLDHRAAWALAGRGECRLQQGDVSGALADLDRALAIHRYAEGYGWRAEARRRAGDLRGALADADAALRLKPGLVLVYVTRALVRAGLGDERGQLADLKRASRLDAEVGRRLGLAS